MTLLRRPRELFVDGPNSLGERSRQRRWQLFLETFPDLAELRVVDLGGTAEFWLRSPVRPTELHLVNLYPSEVEFPKWMRETVADACDVPRELRSGTYDLVYSNSVIEHVGGHVRRLQFAATVEALAPNHWIQTPYRYFPVEPHWVCPGLQYLPLALRARIGMHWPLVHTKTEVLDVAIEGQLGIELLDLTSMRHYFPTSRIVKDKYLGITKSIVAVRSSH